MTAPEYSVVVPCYRSGDWLHELVDGISRALSPHEFEIVLVNDGSPDDVTWRAISGLAADNARVRGIDLARNVGQFAALMCGLGAARGDKVITIDDDLQHPPEEIPKLIEALADDIDVVIGIYEAKQHHRFRNLGSSLMNRVFRSFGKPDEIRMGSFRLMRRSVVDTLLSFGTVRPVPGAMILQATSRIKNVEVRHAPRVSGESGYSITRLVSSTIDNVINASTAPLRLISGIGLLTAVLSGAVMIFYLLRALIADQAVPGFSTTVILITFFGGMSLLAIGMLGEYVARIVAETAQPPLYAVRARTWDPVVTQSESRQPEAAEPS